MSQTNRTLNRILLAMLGLLLLAAGALTAAAGLIPGISAVWTAAAESGLNQAGALLATAPVPGTGLSWWAVAGIAGLILGAGLSIAWLASQGGGRSFSVATDRDGERGKTVVDAGLVAASISGSLAGDRRVLNSAVSAWDVKGATGIRLRLEARQGASPREIADTAEELVQGLDRQLGHPVPVLVRITSGTRSKLAGVDRAR